MSDAVAEAVENLRQAMLDRGDDPTTVDAQLHAVQPKTTNLVGNYADLQRLGAIATTGTMPTPPGESDIDTTNLVDAFVEPQSPSIDENGKSPNVAGDAADAGGGSDWDSMTNDELKAELDKRGIEYSSSDRKADLIAALEES